MASIKSTFVFLLSAISFSLSAQSFSFGDLFGQAKKLQQNYLQQVLALNAFRAQLSQGYNVIKNGLSGIADINTGELNANKAYYAYRKAPSGAVKNNVQVKDIMALGSLMPGLWKPLDGLNPDEARYVAAVRAEVVSDTDADLDALADLLSNKYEMTDEERLKRLAVLHAAMVSRYVFSRDFMDMVKAFLLQRGMNNTETLQQLYEIP